MVRNAEGERILEFEDDLNLIVYNTIFAKREIRLVKYESGKVTSQIYFSTRMHDKNW